VSVYTEGRLTLHNWYFLWLQCLMTALDVLCGLLLVATDCSMKCRTLLQQG